jgi:hypothetical protein
MSQFREQTEELQLSIRSATLNRVHILAFFLLES